MAHHQGMSLLAIANFLRGDVVQRWFHSHPRVQATELLLQEKPAGRPQRPRARVS
jgi:cyclic beta-1,2-glucan synthetase